MNKQELEQKLEEVKAQVKEIEEELQKENIKEDKLEEFWNEEYEKMNDTITYKLNIYGNIVSNGIPRIQEIKYGQVGEEQYMRKKALYDKILNELYLFAKSKNDLASLEEINDSCLGKYHIAYDYENKILYCQCLEIISSEWIPFKTLEIAEEAMELFKDDLEEYYNMKW